MYLRTMRDKTQTELYVYCSGHAAVPAPEPEPSLGWWSPGLHSALIWRNIIVTVTVITN